MTNLARRPARAKTPWWRWSGLDAAFAALAFARWLDPRSWWRG